MTVGDEDVSARGDDDIGRLVEEVGTGARDTGLAERHQHFAVRTELEDLMAFAVLAPRVGQPEIPLTIDGGTVREVEHAGAPAGQQRPAAVVFQDWRFGSPGARIGETAVHDVEGAVWRRLDRRHGSPLDAGWQLPPIACRPIRLGQVVSGRGRLALPVDDDERTHTPKPGEKGSNRSANFHAGIIAPVLASLDIFSPRDAERRDVAAHTDRLRTWVSCGHGATE